MQPIYFTALLKLEDGQLLEYGTACVSESSNSIVFKNEFIPLLRLGTKVKVARLLGEQEVQCFEGEVYLSSKTLLKITGIDETVMAEARKIFSSNASVQATMTLQDSHDGSYTKGDGIDGRVYYLSPHLVKFVSMEQVALNHRLVLQLGKPVRLRKIVIQIDEKVAFSRMATSYLCTVLQAAPKDKQSLADYEQQKASELQGLPD